MPVIGVLAEADVADDEQVRHRAFHCPDGLLHDSLVVVSLRAGGVLRRRNPKENDAAQPERCRPLGVLHQLIDGELRHAGKGGDGAAHSFAMHNELRPHELRRYDVCLRDEAAKAGGATQPPHAANRELCGHRASKLAAPSLSSKRATASPAASGFPGSSSAEAES